jgi:hypothetical protein
MNKCRLEAGNMDVTIYQADSYIIEPRRSLHFPHSKDKLPINEIIDRLVVNQSNH